MATGEIITAHILHRFTCSEFAFGAMLYKTSEYMRPFQVDYHHQVEELTAAIKIELRLLRHTNDPS